MAIPLTADFIRGLSGLSASELPNSVIEELKVIDIAEEAALAYPSLTDYESLYYKGWKAITIIGPSFLLTVAEKIQDNFNQFSRFDNVKDLIDYAFENVSLVENPGSYDIGYFTAVVPDIDPVVNEAR